MEYIEAPQKIPHRHEVEMMFMAGGITGCPDWQKEMTKMLADTGLTLLNPRRADFPIGNPDAAQEQIEWEYKALRESEAILFWFPKETLCPIVLYELGAWSMAKKQIYVGVHPQYQRRQDVEIQTRLVRPGTKIFYSVQDLADGIHRLHF